MPSFKFAFLLIIGILIGSQYEFNLLIIITLIFFLTLVQIYFYKNGRKQLPSFVNVCILIIFFGLYKSNIDFYIIPDNSIKYIPDTKRKFNIELTGIIKDLPDYDSSKIRFVLKCKNIKVSNSFIEIEGDVIVTIWENFYKDVGRSKPALEVGDEVSLKGKFSDASGQRNPGEFDYEKYLALHEIYKIFTVTGYENIKIISKSNLNLFYQKILFPAKVFALGNIDKHFHGDEASYLKSLVTGERSDISYEMKESFIDAGVMHLIAVSGLNVAYIIIAVMLILSIVRVPFIIKIIVTIIFLIFYCLLTGSSASIVRATIMGILFLSSLLLERKINFYNIIGMSLIIILVYDSKQLFDPGFILSYSAVLSMAIFYNRFENLFIHKITEWRIRSKKFIFYIFVLFFTTLAAQIGTLPIIAMYFAKISFISLFANIIAVPLANISLAIGLFQIIAGIFSEFLSSVISETNLFLLTVQLSFIKWCASLDFAYIYFYKFNLLNILLYYTILILFFTIKDKKQIIFRLILSCLIIVSMALSNYGFEKKLTISFLDVGQGDCAIVHTPNDKIILIDGGTSTFTYNSGERTIAPYLRRNGFSKIDLLIITHLHNDHIGGINYLLENFKIGKIIESGQRFKTPFIYTMDSLILNKNISKETVRSGDMIDEIEDIRLYFVFPNQDFVSNDGHTLDDNLNNGSVAFILKYKDVEIFFSGDIEHEAEKFLYYTYSDFLKTEILKCAHHGSITSTSIPFILKNRPNYAIISCGMFNKFNHPSPIVLKRLENFGTRIYRTDNDGAVIIESDGKTINIIDWK